ncbi:ketopantoate reductase family protein [Curtobacterium herbarum]|uniref:2-dehydropantoate 2-reductase N-terminal domain-containing protein n=1 Tax=Curtobacterium herbarum TaxID=150122 RepID=A0ABP4K681_9MICO|nr:2-dehydropantoate 2-reductase N-terminal domain-containing protein [Curtobacterium herbarum]MBM7474375.1 2-dehydropantoate 2-reductase [Curtobacterium herbarum]MCS6545761.1 ketopantoate reductase [Curtobacterium herbarum]
MRILMLGRGVIATVYGQAFAHAGHDVVHHVRPRRLAEYREPVPMDLIDGRLGPLGRRTHVRYAAQLQSSTEPDDRFDLVVISVGHHQLQEASAALAPHIGDATVVVLGNVWDELDAAVAPIPADQVVFGFPGAGGGFRTDGSLHGAVLRSVTLGRSGSAPNRRGQEARAVFRQAGFTVRDEPDIRGWLFLHVVLDAGMFSQALESGGLAAMIGDRRALGGAFRTSRELLPVLEARGVDLARHRTATVPARFPGATGTALALATVVVPIARASLAAHDDPQAAEPCAVLRDLSRTARALGIATPRLDRAVGMVTRPDRAV